MTWLNLVRKYFPRMKASEVEYLLWEQTAFPVGKPRTVETQLRSEYRRNARWKRQGMGHFTIAEKMPEWCTSG